MERKVTSSLHPLASTHPATGEKSLDCNGTYACGIDGLTEAESGSSLDPLGLVI
jgi:taurine dioxygenase